MKTEYSQFTLVLYTHNKGKKNLVNTYKTLIISLQSLVMYCENIQNTK